MPAGRIHRRDREKKGAGVKRLVTQCVLGVLGIVAAMAAISNAGAEGALRNITLEDMQALRHVSDIQVSPDGKWIAYSVRSIDEKKDRGSSQIFMISRDGRSTVQLTDPQYSATSPLWNFDGRYLAFLSARGEGGKTQVWTLDLRGGEAQQQTDVPQGVNEFRWSPNDESMVLLIKDQSENDLRAAEARKKGESVKPRPWAIDRLAFKKDYVGYLDGTHTHVYLLPKRGAAPVQLTFGDFDDTQPAWSPDGKSIAFVSNRTKEPDANLNTDIWVVSAARGAAAPTPLQVTTSPSQDRSPAWSHDSKSIAYVSTHNLVGTSYGNEELMLVAASGGEPRSLTHDLDRSIPSWTPPVFAKDDKSIYVELEDSGEVHLARIDVKTRKLTRPYQERARLVEFDLDNSGQVYAVVSKPTVPAEIYRLTGDRQQLTNINTDLMKQIRLGDVEAVTFKSKDGTPVEQFIYTPPGDEKKSPHPTIVQLHGGPVMQNDYGFNASAQLFAANGYAVLLPNFRGSSGYGEEFSKGAYAAWGKKDVEDVLAGVQQAVDSGIADKDRLGVGGWSYGGILGVQVITQTHMFKGAIVGAGEALYTPNYGVDMWQVLWESEFGLPWERRDLWEGLSPYYNLPKVTTPTMFVGGKEDLNVPIGNAEGMYAVLRRVGIPTQLVIYPGEFHVVQRPSFQHDLTTRQLDWFEKYVKSGAKGGEGTH